METNLNILVKGFNNEDTARTVGNVTIEAIRALEQVYQLDISKLMKVIISFDFSVALLEIADDFNHKLSPTFTNTKQATAIAQLLPKLADNGLLSEYALVLDVTFFYELLNDDGTISLNNINQIIHRLHHELVHIHELNKNSLDNSKLIDDYDHAFLMTGKRAWSEYLANYMSSPTATDESIKMMFCTLENVLNEVPNEIEDLVFKYQIRLIPLEEMHSAVTEKIKLIANMYGYAYGYIQGLDIDMEANFPNLLKLLSSSKLAVPLKELGEALVSIKAKFDDGGLYDYDVFNSTTKAIDGLYTSFRLKIERTIEQNTGLYIHII
jgi:hypothetical protein